MLPYTNVQKKSAIAQKDLVPLSPVTNSELRQLLPFQVCNIQPYSNTVSLVSKFTRKIIKSYQIALVLRVNPEPIIANPSTDEEYQQLASITGMPKKALKIKHQQILKGAELVIYPVRRVLMPRQPLFLGTFDGQLQRLNYLDARDLKNLPVLPLDDPKPLGLVLGHKISLGQNNWIALPTHQLTEFRKSIVKEFESALMRK